MGAWMDGLMGGVMSNHQNRINLDLNEMKLCVKIDLWRCPHLWMHVCLACWVGSCQITKN